MIVLRREGPREFNRSRRLAPLLLGLLAGCRPAPLAPERDAPAPRLEAFSRDAARHSFQTVRAQVAAERRRAADGSQDANARHAANVWAMNMSSESSPLLQGRARFEVRILRADLLLLAAEGGAGRALWPRVREHMAFALDARSKAAALRAGHAALLPATELRAYLDEITADPSADEGLSLEPTSPDEPGARTTIRAEAARVRRALEASGYGEGRLGSHEAP